MQRILLFLFTLQISLFTTFAQPSWVKKTTKSVFTLKTFAADGSMVGSSNGFFTGTNGEAVSTFAPFKGAVRAVIIDAQGKETPVVSILGANDIYDVCRFRTDAKKTTPLLLSIDNAPVGSTVWLLLYREVKNLPSGLVRKMDTFQENHAYYTIALTAPAHAEGCPLLNDAGEAIGILQSAYAVGDTLSYAPSARFAESLHTTGLTMNEPTLQLTKIKKELPDDLKEANLAIYLAGSQNDSTTYVTMIEDMIQKFPDAPDGYTYRAQMAANSGRFQEAERDMEQAIRLSQQKDEPHYTYARMIYNKEVFQSELSYDSWSLDKALAEIREAISINPQPTYIQQEAHILFAQKQYAEACKRYIELTESPLRSAELFYSAARCQAMLRDTTFMLALMDSTVNMFSKPYLKEAAPYLWERATVRREAGKYRDAISDMNEYEQLMSTTVNDNFYYIRHQTEIQARLYQQALNDIDRAIQLNPKETLYYAEKASLQIRVGLYDAAEVTAQECIAVDPENSDGYLFLGLTQCLKGNKQQGIENLRRAKDMGDTQAETLIEKYK